MAFDGTGWQRAYAAAIERLAFEAAAKCVHAYDPDTYIDAVAASSIPTSRPRSSAYS